MNYREYILETVRDRARLLYPNSLDQQHQYIIGFLTARLADEFRYDSHSFYRYRSRVCDPRAQLGPAARG